MTQRIRACRALSIMGWCGRRRKLRSALLSCGAAALQILGGAGLPAQAAAPNANGALVARGEHLALTICANCHVVADDQPEPPILKQPTPSFREIANRPGTSAKSLKRFIATTHWDMKTTINAMPNLHLSGEQAAAVTAYILSLRKP